MDLKQKKHYSYFHYKNKWIITNMQPIVHDNIINIMRSRRLSSASADHESAQIIAITFIFVVSLVGFLLPLLPAIRSEGIGIDNWLILKVKLKCPLCLLHLLLLLLLLLRSL